MCPEKKKAVKKGPIDVILEQHRDKLMTLQDDPSYLLPTLLHRDRVALEFKKISHPKLDQINNLLESDGQFKEILEAIPLGGMNDWRKSLQPEAGAWWWNFDKEQEAGTGKDVIWALIAGTFFVLTTALALEIIKRFWEGAPDSISVIGSLITVFITSSPFLKQGQDFSRSIFGKTRLIKPQHQIRLVAGMSLIAFLLILSVRLVGIQSLSLYYNNRGFLDLRTGNVADAQQAFERAASLNPDQVVPYHNLADFYQQIGLMENAESWYQKAIEQDVNFSPAYSGLGYLYNVQGEFEKAELILLSGLNTNSRLEDARLQSVTHYQLLGNLGWAYFAQEKSDLAIDALEDAISLEPELKKLGESNGSEYRSAIPHFFLAQLYELLGQSDDAQHEWEESLRYLDSNDWQDREWLEITLANLE